MNVEIKAPMLGKIASITVSIDSQVEKEDEVTIIANARLYTYRHRT